jgi:hypothetical protein
MDPRLYLAWDHTIYQIHFRTSNNRMQTYLRSWNAQLGEIGTEQRRKRKAYAHVVKLAKRRRGRRKKKWRGKHKEAATVALWRKNLPEEVLSHIAKYVPFNKPLSTKYGNYGKNALCRAAAVMNDAMFSEYGTNPLQSRSTCQNSSTMLSVFYGVVMAPHYYGAGFSPHHCKILKSAENALLLNVLEGGINWRK